ncbi:MAG: GGDEF domain-containing protein [Desulfobacterales bacterium]|nr:MAG: GGDEF domain-containing protein [Desulfobacterales bacterium]
MSKNQLIEQVNHLNRQISELNRLRYECEQMKEMVSQANENVEAIFNNALDAILIVSMQTGAIIHVNPSTCRLLGYSPNELDGKIFSDLFSDKMDKPIDDITFYDGVLQDQPFNRADGSICFTDLSATVIRWEDTDSALISLRDITERKKAEEQVIYLSHHDNLTNLPNRNLLMERIQQALPLAKRHRKKVAILYIDLDKFKPINDTFGHQAGDKALITTAERMKSCVRESDTIARVGGDEFVIVLQDIVSPKSAELVANKVIKEICSPLYIDEKRCELGASVGLSLYPDHGGDTDTIIKNADTAMYQAKKRGGNNFHLYQPGDDT